MANFRYQANWEVVCSEQPLSNLGVLSLLNKFIDSQIRFSICLSRFIRSPSRVGMEQHNVIYMLNRPPVGGSACCPVSPGDFYFSLPDNNIS